MRIYTKAGDLAFKTFTFPDGQPHFKLETYEREFSSVTVEMALKSPADLFMSLLVADVLRQHGYAEVNLDVRYLLAARMDRAISSAEPYTLATVARLINGAGFRRVRILDVHSEVATRLIRNSENVLPKAIVRQVWNTVHPVSTVAPDKGATGRVRALFGEEHYIRQCYKKRDPETGVLSGFDIGDTSGIGKYLDNFLIVDDICDGGGTFVGLAKELRKAGAKKVFLYVTHGIFSKGLPLEGIDKIFTTDSYQSFQNKLGYPTNDNNLVIIPISMKELP